MVEISMITKWRLKNFKSVQTASLPIRPLTVISGANSSGKSTILQSMVVVAQTLSNQLEREALLLNGHLMRLGQFRDVCSLTSEDEEFSIGWEIEPQDDPNNDAITPAVMDDLSKVPSYATRSTVELKRISSDVTFGTGRFPRPEVTEGRLDVEPAKGDSVQITWEIDFENSSLEHESETPKWVANLDVNSQKTLQEKYGVGGSEKCDLRHFLPSRIAMDVRGHERDSDFRAQVLCQQKRVLKLDNDLLTVPVPEYVINLLPNIEPKEDPPPRPEHGASFAKWTEWMRGICDLAPQLKTQLPKLANEVREALTRGATDNIIREHTHLPGRFPDAVSYLETFFATKFRYLGPLRDEPRSIYPYPMKLDPIDLGCRGEYTAAAYHAHKTAQVRHTNVKELAECGSISTDCKASLETAVNDWLRFLGVADHLVSSEEKYGHLLGIGTGKDNDWEMIHVGTGASQVLPILVLGLLAQTDDTLLIEHPELHLHPQVQTRLADFFLFLARSGRQVIIETHSEHIINRIRYRIVLDESNTINHNVGILFAELDNGITNFRDVIVTEYGAIQDWPKGFFDEGALAAERIIRAAIDRKAKTS